MRYWHLFAVVDCSWNMMAHGDARKGKWRGNCRMQLVASTLHTTSEHGVSSITTADAHTSAASSRLNWRPIGRFKWTRPFRTKDEIWFLRVCHHISTGLYLFAAMYRRRSQSISCLLSITWPQSCLYCLVTVVGEPILRESSFLMTSPRFGEAPSHDTTEPSRSTPPQFWTPLEELPWVMWIKFSLRLPTRNFSRCLIGCSVYNPSEPETFLTLIFV